MLVAQDADCFIRNADAYTHCFIRNAFHLSVFVPFRGDAGLSEVAWVLLLEQTFRMWSPAYFQGNCHPRKHKYSFLKCCISQGATPLSERGTSVSRHLWHIGSIKSNCLGDTFSKLDSVMRTTDPIIPKPFRKCYLTHLSSGTHCWDIQTVVKCQLIHSADYHGNVSTLNLMFSVLKPSDLWGLSFWIIVNIKESISTKANGVTLKIVTLPLKSTGVTWVGADGTCFFFITSVYSFPLVPLKTLHCQPFFR